MTPTTDLALFALLGAAAGYAMKGTARAAVGGAAAGLGGAVLLTTLGGAAAALSVPRAPSPWDAYIDKRFADLASPAGSYDGFNQGPGF